MTRLIVHIGMPKTATTSLQTFFSKTREKLAESGILYPRLSHLSHAHHMLMPLFLGPESAWSRVKKNYAGPRKLIEGAEADWESLVRTVSTAGAHTVVLSTESLFVTLSEPYLAAFCSRLRSISSDIDVVAYVRDPASYYASILTHRAKRTVNPRPAEPIAYAAPLLQFERMLGRKPTVRVFARDMLEKGDLIEDFFKHVIGGGVRRPPGKVEANVTLSAEVAEIFQTYKAVSTGRKTWSRNSVDVATIKTLCAVERSVSTRKPLKLTDAVYEAMTAPTDDLKWLRDEHAITFPTVDYGASGPGSAALVPQVRRLRDGLVFDDEAQSKIIENLEHSLPEVYAAVRSRIRD